MSLSLSLSIQFKDGGGSSSIESDGGQSSGKDYGCCCYFQEGIVADNNSFCATSAERQ